MNEFGWGWGESNGPGGPDNIEFKVWKDGRVGGGGYGGEIGPFCEF